MAKEIVDFDLKKAQEFLEWEGIDDFPNGTETWERIFSSLNYPRLEVVVRRSDRLMMVSLMDVKGGYIQPTMGIHRPAKMELEQAVRVELGNLSEIKTVRFLEEDSGWIQVSSDSQTFFASPLETPYLGPSCTIKR